MKNAQHVVEELLQHAQLATVSTVDDKGKPNSASVFFVMDAEMNVYFPTRSESRKYKNIATNSSVSIAITDAEKMQTLQLQGTAKEVEDAEIAIHMIEQLISATGDQRTAAGRWMPPVKQIRDGHFAIIKVTPNWMRLADFSDDTAKQENKYTQLI